MDCNALLCSWLETRVLLAEKRAGRLENISDWAFLTPYQVSTGFLGETEGALDRLFNHHLYKSPYHLLLSAASELPKGRLPVCLWCSSHRQHWEKEAEKCFFFGHLLGLVLYPNLLQWWIPQAALWRLRGFPDLAGGCWFTAAGINIISSTLLEVDGHLTLISSWLEGCFAAHLEH